MYAFCFVFVQKSCCYCFPSLNCWCEDLEAIWKKNGAKHVKNTKFGAPAILSWLRRIFPCNSRWSPHGCRRSLMTTRPEASQYPTPPIAGHITCIGVFRRLFSRLSSDFSEIWTFNENKLEIIKRQLGENLSSWQWKLEYTFVKNSNCFFSFSLFFFSFLFISFIDYLNLMVE